MGASSNDALALLRATIGADGAQVAFTIQSKAPKLKVGEASRAYLGRRSDELRHGGFKSVRYSVGLFTSKYHDQALVALGREDGRAFLSAIARLSPVIGKSESTRGHSLDQLVAYSSQGHRRITPRTQRRIWSQVLHFLDWAVYEGQLEQNPFRTVRFEGKVVPAPYAVPTDAEVSQLLAVRDRRLHALLITCLLTGMRAGEAAGLLRADLINKGNLGTFVHVRPNSVRELKTRTSERVVPVHAELEAVLAELPAQGRLFPDLTVNDVTKRFAVLRRRLGLERAGLVFHSTRKWFVTQCERTGVPEHFTASLVGHQSARSENGLTYGIYSAGISDDQKRGIIDQIRLPT